MQIFTFVGSMEYWEYFQCLETQHQRLAVYQLLRASHIMAVGLGGIVPAAQRQLLNTS